MEQDWFSQIAEPVNTQPVPRTVARPAPALVPLTPPKPKEPPSGYEFDGAGGLRPVRGGPADPAAKPNDPPSGYEWDGRGGLRPITGGPADPSTAKPKAETGEEKTAAFLATRVAGGLATLNSLGDAGRPTMYSETVGNLPVVGNSLTDTDRQRRRSAELDVLDAALTLGTGAAYTKEQLEGYRRSYFPELGDKPEVLADKRQRLKLLLESARVKAGAAAPQIDAALKAAGFGEGRFGGFDQMIAGQGASGSQDTPPVPGTIGTAPGAGGGPGGGSGPTPSEGRPEITTGAVKFATDTDRRYAAILQSILDRGGTFADAMAVAREYGNAPTGKALTEFRQAWNEALRWNKRNGKTGWGKAKVSIPQSGRRDTSTTEKIVGSIASSPVGAGVVGYANGAIPFDDEIYGGINSFVTGKPMDQAIAEADFKKGLIREKNPTAFALGQVGGGLTTLLATGGVAGIGEGAATLAPRAVALDAGYGALFGAGENNQDRLTGALAGGALGAAGGALGRGVARGAGAMVAPRVAPEIATLRNMGVRMTPGVAAGETASRFEQKLVSVPGVGDMIRGNRNRAIEDFNNGVLNQALGEIGQVLPRDTAGTTAMNFAQNAFNRAYERARSGMRLVADQQMFTDLAQLDRQLAGGGLDQASYDRLRRIYETHVASRLGRGRIDGDRYKSMSSALGKLARGTGQTNPELSAAIRDMQGIIDNAARRASSPEAVAALDAADRGYALFVRAENAAKARGGDMGTFTPRAFDAAVQKGDSSVRSKAYLRGEALGQDLAAAGRRLGDEVPNSGTVDRLMAMGIAGGAGYISPASLMGLGTMGVTQLPGVRGALVGMMTRQAGPRMQTIGDAIRARAQLSGAATSPLLLAYGQSQ